MLKRLLPWVDSCKHENTEWVTVGDPIEGVYGVVDYHLDAAVARKEQEQCMDCGDFVLTTTASGYEYPKHRFREYCRWSLDDADVIDGDPDDLPSRWHSPGGSD